jgi:hypothetical protein
MREENTNNQAQIAKYNNRMVKQFDRWDLDGLPIRQEQGDVLQVEVMA